MAIEKINAAAIVFEFINADGEVYHTLTDKSTDLISLWNTLHYACIAEDWREAKYAQLDFEYAVAEKYGEDCCFLEVKETA